MLSIPFIMVGMSMAIKHSSHQLSMITGISFMQFITALGISILFIPLAFAAGLLVKMTKGIKAGDIVKIPLFMVTMSLAVMLSSHVLNEAADVPYSKMLNVLATGVTIAVLGIALGGAMVGGLAVVIVSGAIALSSHILAMGDYSKYPDVDWSAGVGLSMLAFGLATLGLGMAILATGGIGLLAIAGGALATVVIAGAIMVSSHILAAGDYGSAPSAAWTGGVGLAMLAFGLPILVLGMAILATAGLGLLAVYAGVEAVTTIAQTVVDSSIILAGGNYSSAPSAEWTGGVGLSMLAFGIPILALGVAILATAGLGLLAIYAGAEAVTTIAEAIVDSSVILSGGSYGNFPNFDWATGVGISLMAFAPAVVALGLISAIPFVGGKILDGGKVAVLGIAQTIVEAADILGKGNFAGGPTEKWATGVSLALGAFSPIYAMMIASGAMSAIFGGGVSVTEFSTAIKTISEGIINSATLFDGVKWGDGPSEKWAKGVGGAIGAFAPVFEILSANSGWMSSSVSPETFKTAIDTISQGIIDSAAKFDGQTWGGYPSVEWVAGVGGAIGAFTPIFDLMMKEDFDEDNLELMNESIVALSSSMVDTAEIFFDGQEFFNNPPDTKWGESVSSVVEQFAQLNVKLSELDYDEDADDVRDLTEAMVKVAKMFSKNKEHFGFILDKDYVKNLSSSIVKFAVLVNFIDEYDMADTDGVTDVADGMVSLATILNEDREQFSFKLDSDYIPSISKSIFDYTDLVTDLVNMDLSYSDTMKPKWMAQKMVDTASIFTDNQDAFGFSVKPGFFKAIGANVFDYVSLLKSIPNVGLGDVLSSIAGADPLSNITRGMLKMAGAYDKLASSLNKFGSSINSLDLEKVNSFGMMTNNIAVLSALDSDMFDSMLDVLEDRTSVFADLLKDQNDENSAKASVGETKSGSGEPEVNKSDELNKELIAKFDQMLGVLNNISSNSGNIDEHLSSKIEETKSLM
jgi:hypothetical protein